MDPEPTNPLATDLNGEEISPVRLKMATLPTRSSFASFFCKNNKKGAAGVKVKTDPLLAEMGTEVKDFKENLTQIEKEPISSLKNEDYSVKSVNCGNIKQEPTTSTEEEPVYIKKEVPIYDTIISGFTTADINATTTADITNTTATPTTTTNTSATPTTTLSHKNGNVIILISDSDESDNDIRIIPKARRTSQRRNNKVVECISISSGSDDNGEVKILNRRSTRKNPNFVPLSDYSDLKRKKIDFSPMKKGSTKVLDEKEILYNETATNTSVTKVSTNTSVTKVSTNTTVATTNTAVAKAPITVTTTNNINNTATAKPTVTTTNTSITKPAVTTTNTATAKPVVTNTNTATSNPAAATAVTQAKTPVMTTPTTPSTPTKTTSSTTFSSLNKSPGTPSPPSTTLLTQPIKSPTLNSDFITSKFKNLDPSLMNEMLTRLSQRPKNDEEISLSQSTAAAPTTTTTKTNTANNNNTVTSDVTDKFLIFEVLQRLNLASFDASQSANGQLTLTPTFQIVWKATESFGNLKKRIADLLRLTPFNLVITRVSDNSELYDTTKPVTLNLKGLPFNDLMALIPPVSKPVKTTTKNSKNTVVNNANSKTVVNNLNSMTVSNSTNSTIANSKTVVSATPLTQVSDNVYVYKNLPNHNAIVKLYLYTRQSYAHFKTLQESKKRKMFDSLSFLQTADAEFSRLTQDSLTFDDADNESLLTAPLSLTQTETDTINIKVKTAANKHQCYNIKVPRTATITSILDTLKAQHNIDGTKVIFDGDVLTANQSIADLLEDDDMIEVK